MKTFGYSVLIFCFVFSCKDGVETLTETQSSSVQDSVRQMMETTARDVSKEGPIAWLDHFENSKDFYMASGGILVFPNNDSATNFVKNVVVKMMPKVELHWNNIRITPINTKYADIAANFHEEVTDSAGNRKPMDGFFTGMAQKADKGWQFLNAHWSFINSK